MKKILSILFLLYFINNVQAQKTKVIYGEILGNGIFFASINYDQRLTASETGLGFRVGVSFLDPARGDFTFPIMLNYLVGGTKHQLELGAGFVFITTDIVFSTGDDLSGLAYAGSLMYRFNFDSGWVIRFGYTPTIDNTSLPAWLGLSVGRKF